jgi:hypothetical protein
VLHLGKILGFFYRTSIQKNKMKSRAGRVAQVVEHLISKREALTEFKLQYWKKKRLHLTSMRMTIIKSTNHWWECKLVQKASQKTKNRTAI